MSISTESVAESWVDESQRIATGQANKGDMETILEINVGFGFICLYQYDARSFVIRQLGSAWFIFDISPSDLISLCYSAERLGTIPKLESLKLIYCAEDKDAVIQYVYIE